MKSLGGIAKKGLAYAIYAPVAALGFISIMTVIVPGLVIMTALEWSEKVLGKDDKYEDSF